MLLKSRSYYSGRDTDVTKSRLGAGEQRSDALIIFHHTPEAQDCQHNEHYKDQLWLTPGLPGTPVVTALDRAISIFE